MDSLEEAPDLAFNVLRSGDEFVLYRGFRPGKRSVLGLTVAAQAPSSQVIGRLKHEFSLQAELDPAWAARPVALTSYEGGPMLLLEDFGGDPLDQVLESKDREELDLTAILGLAVELSAALGRVHRQGLIHKDIKPANVLVDASGRVRLTGFGIASRQRSEHNAPSPPELIAGTLPYMAPEQTGRMNRSTDARSDLYSFGVTLYELLTGCLPFPSSDPMELIHCHVARQPPLPSERVHGLPGAVDAIVLKLLAKDPEDRYQTAAGAEADLRQCLSAWLKDGRISLFQLGQRDYSDRLLMPERLYGREEEVGALHSAFERVCTERATKLVLVSGYSGIGKSSIVNELHKVLTPRRGLFIAGKFDQYKRDIPYATLAQAFRSLVRLLLSKSDAELAGWRDQLLAAVGPNGQLMVNLVPELALVIGEQPPVSSLDPQSAKARFHLVLRDFLRVFARPEHPLVLFIDDLQWLDTGTLEVLARLAVDADAGHLLLVGAYRDNEVGPTHPLSKTLADVLAACSGVAQVTLGPLQPEHVAQLTADALHSDIAGVLPLAGLVFEKTGGNPFFATQFIAALVDDGLLAFHSESRTWKWDIDRIRHKGVTDHVADLLTEKLGRLDLDARKALGQLACLGNVADLPTLARVLERSPAKVHAVLRGAVDAGLVRNLSGSFAFSHDRVQEAAYALIPETDRAATHLRLGRVLLSLASSTQSDDKLFDVVNQFDRGASAIHSPAEREQVAGLHLVAGTRAMASSAHASARAYLDAGRSLLGEHAWERQYRLAFDLELLRAECEIVVGELESAEQHLTILAQHASGLSDQAGVVCLAVLLYFTTGRSVRAVEVALAFLSQAGTVWSPEPTEAEVREEYFAMRRLLARRPMKELIDLPTMSDAACIATMKVLTELFPAAYAVNRYLMELVLLRMTNLSLEHGNCESSAVAYSALNMALGSHFSDYTSAYGLGELACELVDRHGPDRYKARVYSCVAAFAMPWVKHLPLCQPLMRAAFELGRTMGDKAFAAYNSRNLITHLLVTGTPLAQVQREAEHAIGFAAQLQLGLPAERFIGQLDLVRRLRDLPDAHLPDDEWAEHDVESQPGLAMMVCYHWVFRLQALYFSGDYSAALQAAARVEPMVWAMRSAIEEAEYDFYAALTRAAACDRSSAEQRDVHLGALRKHHSRTTSWADHGPENFAHRAALLGAEIARLEGRELDAQRLYEEAVRLAREHGFLQNEAIANELAGHQYERRGLHTAANAYLRNARSCYARWGALGKVKQLEARHPALRERAAPARLMSTIDAPVALLDVKTVDKASQTLSREMVFPSLLQKLMRLTVEHAGAERGVLVLLQDGQAHIEAEAVTAEGTVEVTISRIPVGTADLPTSMLQYVLRTRELVVLDDASAEGVDLDDQYVRQHRPRSVLCLPILKDATVIGALYLENNLTTRAFTADRVTVLDFLASQAAIALENSRLYSELQRSEAFLAEGQAISHTGSFEWDIATGRVTWSAELFSIFEYAPTTIPTLELALQRIHPEDVPFVTQQIERAQGGHDFAYEHRLRMSDGRVKYVGLAAHASKDELGNVRFVGAVMDVTERKVAEIERERLGRRLREVEKMEAIGRLAGGIAHDFNNVLGGIVAYGEMLFEDAPEGSPRRRHAQNVLTAANRGRALVDQILAYSRSQRGKREPTSISRAVAETVDLVHGSLAATVRLTLDVPARALVVMGDPTQLHQVVMNLCSNAIHAMPGGGTLHVALAEEQVDHERGLSLGKLEAGAYARLSVVDTGCGMDRATLSRIFEPFFTTKEVGRGTGLGLSLVAAIVVELGGAIDVVSETKRGSTFAVYLPIAQVST